MFKENSANYQEIYMIAFIASYSASLFLGHHYMSFWKICFEGDHHLWGSWKAFNTFIVSSLCIMVTVLPIASLFQIIA